MNDPVENQSDTSEPETEKTNWSRLWVCTKKDEHWSIHEGEKVVITESGVAMFYAADKLTGVCSNYEDVFRKDLLDIEWLYDIGIENRPVTKLEPQATSETFEVEVGLNFDSQPMDSDGFYSVENNLPEPVLGLPAAIIYVVLKYSDGNTETGAWYPETREFKRSYFSSVPNLSFSKLKTEVVGWRYRS